MQSQEVRSLISVSNLLNVEYCLTVWLLYTTWVNRNELGETGFRVSI